VEGIPNERLEGCSHGFVVDRLLKLVEKQENGKVCAFRAGHECATNVIGSFLLWQQEQQRRWRWVKKVVRRGAKQERFSFGHERPLL